MANQLAGDLDEVLAHTAGLWEELRGKRLFITGGTGFFGCWLLESFTWACDRLQLGAQVVVLTRDAAAFREKAPHLAAHPAVQLLPGDVRSFEFPPGEFACAIHAATETRAGLGAEDPLALLDTIVDGTRRVLEFARQSRVQRLLFTSSGAVYGVQPPRLSHVPEDFIGAPDVEDPRNAYGHGKRLAEHLCILYGRQYGLEVKLARCFAFIGPYLNLDVHFAAGNFIADALRGGPIRVAGDGTPYRTYLYSSDLAVWLWTILLRGQPGRPYNVGSDLPVSIRELAEAVAAQFDPRPVVEIARQPAPGRLAARYVPSTRRAREELDLGASVNLAEAIRRTAMWFAPRRTGSVAKLMAG